MNALYLLAVFICFGLASALSGEFVPKSFYTIDEDGQKSDVIYLKKSEIPRVRRSAPGGSFGGGYAYGGASGGSNIAAALQGNLDSMFQNLQNLASRFAEQGGASGGGGSGYSYSGSFGSGGGQSGGHSYSNGFGRGGNAGSSHGQGPVLHSRVAPGEKELVTGGNGYVQASSSASGPNGGFSFSSSSVDSDGRVRYNTNAHKF